MKFHAMMLYIDDEFPTKAILENLSEVGNEFHRKKQFLFSVEHGFIGENRYWMYFQYDNESLYTDVVVDTIDNETKSNPRPKNQVELRQQLFACYDLERKLLYVSDYAKRTSVADYLEEMLQKPVRIKNVIKSLDEFVSAVRYLKSVTFTQRRNLFTTTEDSLFQKQADLYGLDLPERSKLKFDYGHSPVGVARTALQSWGMKRESGEFDEVVVVGVDDEGFENSFNFSTMLSTIEIALSRDENYRYDPDSVRRLLLEKLGA